MTVTATGPARSEGGATQPVLQLRALTKHFGGVSAVDSLDMDVPRGQVLGLMGPNGAGKTSTLNLITGFYRPDSGQVLLDGQDVTGRPSHEVSRLGITRTYQNVRLLSGFSVRDQVVAGMTGSRSVASWHSLWLSRRERADRDQARDRADALLQRVGVVERDEPAQQLSYGTQRRVEIARALATDPRVVLLDEPTAGMNAEESTRVGELVRQLAAEGLTVVLIEHNMRLILEHCDSAFVMSFGRALAHGLPSECVEHPDVQDAYFGRRSDAERLEALRALRRDPRTR